MVYNWDKCLAEMRCSKHQEKCSFKQSGHSGLLFIKEMLEQD